MYFAYFCWKCVIISDNFEKVLQTFEQGKFSEFRATLTDLLT